MASLPQFSFATYSAATQARHLHDAMLDVAGGWHTHLAILDDVLSGRRPRPFWSTHAALEEEYRERIAEAARAPGA